MWDGYTSHTPLACLLFSTVVNVFLAMACPPNSDNVFGPRVNPECRPFDFTLLFEDGFFGLLPAALFLVLTPQRLYILRSSPVKLDSFRLTLVKLVGQAWIITFVDRLS